MGAPSEDPAPIRRRDRRRSDEYRVVDAALAVVEQSLAEMAARETRPLLDAPPVPYRRRLLGPGGVALFPVALGAVGFGSRVPEPVAGGLLDMYRSSGGNTVLTSDSLSGRHGQEVVGRWLASRRGRDTLLLGASVGRGAEPGAFAAGAITASVHEALGRLGTDVLDVLVLGADDRRTPLEETLTAVLALREAGAVRELVLGDYAPDRLIEARVLAGQRALPLVVGVQAPYGLTDRAFERRLAPIVHAQGLGLLARQLPVPPPEPEPVLARRGRAARAAATRFGVADVLAGVAAPRQVSPATVALAWLLTRPSVTAAVVPALSPDDVAAAVAAPMLHLTRAEVAALDDASLR